MVAEKGFITDIEIINDCFKEGFEKEEFEGWKYDLALGNQYFISSNEVPEQLSRINPFLVIKPGEFALLITDEVLKMRMDIMAFISIRFKYKQQGLINISGFHVDPGYQGRIIFSVYNAGPNDIVLRKGDRVFMIFFQGIGIEMYEKSTRQCYNNIPMEMISLIQGKSASLARNTERLDRLEHYIKLYGGIAISIIAVLIGVLLSKYF